MLSLILFSLFERSYGAKHEKEVGFNFYGDSIQFRHNAFTQANLGGPISHDAVNVFYEHMLLEDYQPVVNAMLAYKQRHNPDDWVYYQLIRKTAESLSPKKDDYIRYTLYKWFLLGMSGYDATLNIVGDKLLFYVQSDDDIYDIPYFNSNGKKYICLNYHDYGYNVDFEKDRLIKTAISIPGAKNKFSYKLTQLPSFRPGDYYEKELEFSYRDMNYHFRIKLSDEVKKIFTNYPVADYQLYFNAPLSKETYNSLIPQLRKMTKGLDVKHGVDYLMHFTRYAFLYAPDIENFGLEKSLSPEQTLLYERSDCEDRVALFYYLVKEIYNLPMIVLAFPSHLSIAVKFDKPVGKKIIYNGVAYSVCEPTPQANYLRIGSLSPALKSVAYEVAYVYDPQSK